MRQELACDARLTDGAVHDAGMCERVGCGLLGPAAYREVWPLAEGWRARLPLHQLYPLIAHAVLFGGGYGAHAARVLATLC